MTTMTMVTMAIKVNGEKQLLDGARRLDLAALGRIHDCHYESMSRYALYRIGDSQIAEDAGSEVFLRLMNALHNGKTPRSSLCGWLSGTANNVVNDHFRRY